mmetsp:Transcript_125628/g.361196  ORF Transcript_125628/g.361196 Transcript_125628/m.361196 type:complete len:243 (+) Transcript_125628:1289-2017(+)
MLAGLASALEAGLELAFSRGDDQHADVGLGGPRDHVRHIGLVARGVEHREPPVRSLESGAPDLHGLALGLLLLARVHNVGQEPALAVLVLRLFHVLLDRPLVDATREVEDVAAGRGFPCVDVTDEDDVEVWARVRLCPFALDLRFPRHLLLLGLLILNFLLRLRHRWLCRFWRRLRLLFRSRFRRLRFRLLPWRGGRRLGGLRRRRRGNLFLLFIGLGLPIVGLCLLLLCRRRGNGRCRAWR